MKKYIVLSFAFVLISLLGRTQGCVAIRSLTGFGQFMLPEYNEEPVKWAMNANSRYFRSYQDFNGSENQHVAPENQKVNNVYVIDFAITRMLENGWSVTFDLPFTAADRSTWQEHENDAANKLKRTTRSFGISDIRVTAYKWLFDVSKPHKGNVQAGLGVKLPTGDYNYEDYFYKSTGKRLLPVNQSIQLGDGGTAFSLELNAFYTLNKTVSLYSNAFYLFNPRDQNGTYSGIQETSNNIEAGGNINSVPDSYTIRAGANFTFNDLVLWGGARMEGQPVHDAIGASSGNRRPGKIISVEPGINYSLKGSTTIYAFIPVSIYRATDQSVPDQILDQLDPDNSPHYSTGSFADYMIFIGVIFLL